MMTYTSKGAMLLRSVTQANDQDAWHNSLAACWARYNGQKGTDKQLTRIKRQLGVEDLERMLSARGYVTAYRLD